MLNKDINYRLGNIRFCSELFTTHSDTTQYVKRKQELMTMKCIDEDEA